MIPLYFIIADEGQQKSRTGKYCLYDMAYTSPLSQVENKVFEESTPSQPAVRAPIIRYPSSIMWKTHQLTLCAA